MNWNKLSMFKLPNKHKRFGYVPRYYDAEKEALDKKIRIAKKEQELEEAGRIEREISFRDKTKNRWINLDYKAQTRRSNIRLVIILAIVFIAFYYVFIGLDGIGYFIDQNLDKLK